MMSKLVLGLKSIIVHGRNSGIALFRDIVGMLWQVGIPVDHLQVGMLVVNGLFMVLMSHAR